MSYEIASFSLLRGGVFSIMFHKMCILEVSLLIFIQLTIHFFFLNHILSEFGGTFCEKKSLFMQHSRQIFNVRPAFPPPGGADSYSLGQGHCGTQHRPNRKGWLCHCSEQLCPPGSCRDREQERFSILSFISSQFYFCSSHRMNLFKKKKSSFFSILKFLRYEMEKWSK